MANNSPEIITIPLLPIRLGQFIKLAEIVSEGSEATSLIASGIITVNGATEKRRGRKLQSGDIVEVNGKLWRIATKE